MMAVTRAVFASNVPYSILIVFPLSLILSLNQIQPWLPLVYTFPAPIFLLSFTLGNMLSLWPI